MEKLKLQTQNGVTENLERLSELFPNCVTEANDANGNVKLAVDFDMLRQELSDTLVEGKDERYQFVWPDKKKAILLANAPINATLRPCRKESVDFDNTQNMYIEGDNLDVLKCLKETYLGKVKMIYIDPPYNTGNDFVYNDDFAENASEYLENSGQYDVQGNRLSANLESNGRFHTDWLNMIYPRLKVARELLSKDGAIFISIDDHEEENLKKICDEIFGPQNFVACVVWQRTYAPISLKKYFSENHEFCYIYAKDLSNFKMNLLPRSDKQNKDYKNPDNDPRGVWKVGNLTVGPAVEKQIYPIVGPTGKTFLPPSGYCWRFTKERFKQLLDDNRIWFGIDGNNSPVPKLFLSEVQDGVTPMTLWTYDEVGHGQEGTREFRDLMERSVFTSPKTLRYMKRHIQIGSNQDCIILDFFSGSATTAHAVMQLNAEDGGNRKFIMVQLPELTDEKSEAYKAGYKNICEIGKERIRRAAKKIKEETGADIDYGFRVLKLDSSNMEDVYYTPADVNQGQMDLFADNIKPDRTGEDLLFQVMLELGATLDSKIEKKTINGKDVFVVSDGYIVACFDNEVNDDVVKAIAQMQPQYAVLRDSSMADDSTVTNFEQIFKTFSSGTTCKII